MKNGTDKRNGKRVSQKWVDAKPDGVAIELADIISRRSVHKSLPGLQNEKDDNFFVIINKNEFISL